MKVLLEILKMVGYLIAVGVVITWLLVLLLVGNAILTMLGVS